MDRSGERPQIGLRGLRRRGGVRGAVLVLEGARRAELRRACALAGTLSDRCLLVAVDGGLRTCRAAARRPDLFVGDLDSASRTPRGVPSVVYDRDKDFSDLAGALRELEHRRIQFVTVAGLLGGRLDHEWANLLDLGAASGSFAGILAPADRGTILVTSRGCEAVTVRGRTVSLLALGGAATVSLGGTRWTLRRRRIRPGSLGVSNVTGTSLRLTVHAGAVALLFPSQKGLQPKARS
jgi:thiamine pyrophosphokinase